MKESSAKFLHMSEVKLKEKQVSLAERMIDKMSLLILSASRVVWREIVLQCLPLTLGVDFGKKALIRISIFPLLRALKLMPVLAAKLTIA